MTKASEKRGRYTELLRSQETGDGCYEVWGTTERAKESQDAVMSLGPQKQGRGRAFCLLILS